MSERLCEMAGEVVIVLLCAENNGGQLMTFNFKYYRKLLTGNNISTILGIVSSWLAKI